LGSLVDSTSEVAETLLASSVPYLKFEFVAININKFYFKVDADSGDMVEVDLGVDVAQENVGFADRGVTDQGQFGHLVVGLALFGLAH
jgi:hypothetical protein